MGLTLQEVLVSALKKLEDSSYQGFIEKLSVWEVREQYKNIPKDELTGKDPEHVAGLINEYYKYAYGAEVTLAVLEDIDETKVREELQHDLREVDSSNNGLGTKMFTDRVNFIDDHRSDLIIRITDLDPVLRDLRDQDRLTQEQYNDVMKKTTTGEKMKDLCDIIRYWEDIEKCEAYNVLRKYNEQIIRDLENNRNWTMILKSLAARFTAARYSFYEYKDEDYAGVLDDEYLSCPGVLDDEYLSSSGDHFLDRHEQDLIKRIKIVRPVINDLCRKGLVTGEERDHLGMLTSEDLLMRRLYDIIRDWDDDDKEKVYVTLYQYNPSIIDDLKMLEDSSKLVQQKASKISVMSLMKEDDMSSKSQDSVEVLTPSMTGSSYSLSMNSPGLFRCSESGIQFQVTQPVTIEYEVDSWSNYTEILQNLHGGYEIIGPVFSIKSSAEPNVVSAVYLPHCLCLEGFKDDKSLIRCFHYKDDNMTLETPSRVEAMYVVLENPTFSSIGVILYPLSRLKEEIIKLFPYDGMALLFCNTITRKDLTHKHRLHLYLLPRLRTVEKEVERFQTRYFFQRILKPHQTKSMYSKKIYRINGPLTARVYPDTLEFETSCPSEIYPFTEISIEGEKNTEVKVSIHPEDKDVPVWEAVVTAEEMLNVPSAGLTIQSGDYTHLPKQSDHFVDKHRRDLICKISVIDLVLDDLLQENLLSYEQYNTVLSQNINAEQMRKLYDYIRAWGNDDKDKVYWSLRRHNYPIIKKLENTVPADYNEPRTLAGTFKCNLY